MYVDPTFVPPEQKRSQDKKDRITFNQKSLWRALNIAVKNLEKIIPKEELSYELRVLAGMVEGEELVENKEMGMWFDEPLYWLVECEFASGQIAERTFTDEHIIVYKIEDGEQEIFKRNDENDLGGGGFFSFQEMRQRIKRKTERLNNYNDEACSWKEVNNGKIRSR